MAYAQPTADEIQLLGGISISVENTTEPLLEATIVALVEDAETITALNVGESTFDSTGLTARQDVALRKAVAYRAAARYWRRVQGFRLSGVNEPLMMEESSRFADKAEELETLAASYESLVASGTSTTPYYLPIPKSSTFSGTADSTPSRRLDLLDEGSDNMFPTDPDNPSA